MSNEKPVETDSSAFIAVCTSACTVSCKLEISWGEYTNKYEQSGLTDSRHDSAQDANTCRDPLQLFIKNLWFPWFPVSAPPLVNSKLLKREMFLVHFLEHTFMHTNTLHPCYFEHGITIGFWHLPFTIFWTIYNGITMLFDIYRGINMFLQTFAMLLLFFVCLFVFWTKTWTLWTLNMLLLLFGLLLWYHHVIGHLL